MRPAAKTVENPFRNIGEQCRPHILKCVWLVSLVLRPPAANEYVAQHHSSQRLCIMECCVKYREIKVSFGHGCALLLILCHTTAPFHNGRSKPKRPPPYLSAVWKAIPRNARAFSAIRTRQSHASWYCNGCP